MVKKLSGKSAVILGLFIVSLVMIISMSFAWYIYEGEVGSSFNIGATTSEGPKITYTENKSGITLSKTYPMPDDIGLNTEPYIYTIRNDEDSPIKVKVLFEIMGSSTLENSLVKYSVDNAVSSFGENTERENPIRSEFKDAYVVESFTLEAGESKSSSFRLWVHEDATVENALEKVFSGRITANPEYIE